MRCRNWLHRETVGRATENYGGNSTRVVAAETTGKISRLSKHREISTIRSPSPLPLENPCNLSRTERRVINARGSIDRKISGGCVEYWHDCDSERVGSTAIASIDHAPFSYIIHTSFCSFSL